ncbi:MAG: hypothetical protein ACLFQK_11800, partial [Fibrobacterota bacterium]
MKKILVLKAGVMCLFITACNLQFPLFPNKIEVEITSPEVMSRGLTPAVDTAVAYYKITYTHDEGEPITVTTDSPTHTKENAE